MKMNKRNEKLKDRNYVARTTDLFLLVIGSLAGIGVFS